MSVFVDTGVFYAHHDTDASRHEAGAAALNAVLRSAEYGHVMTSDYIYDESVTLTHRRTGTSTPGSRSDGEFGGGVSVGYRTPPLVRDALRSCRAVTIQETYAKHQLSFTDAMTVAHVEHHDIDCVLSFDDFDGVVTRLVPETLFSRD